MATAASSSSSSASSSTNNFSVEERRWLIIGICLNKVLTPVLRNILGNEIPKWYQTLVKPPNEIDKQTCGKFVNYLPPSKIKLNYVSINNNTAYKSPKMYDYAVKDPLSLAKLFLKPFMAKFSGFDHTMDTSAVLSVMCEAQPFIACGADALAMKVRSDVRNEWAHCHFSYWTEPAFQTALNNIESLVKALGLTTADEQTLLDDIDNWRKNGIRFCFGNLVDSDLLNLIHVEVGNLEKSVSLFAQDSKDEKEKLLHCLQNFKTSLSEEISDLKKKVDQLELKHLTLHNQYISTVQDVEKIKNEVGRMGSAAEEIPYLFCAPEKNPWFVGRLLEIKELATLLQVDDETASKSKVSIAAVCGLGGVGKTSLAVEFAQQKTDYYTGGVYWFSGEDDTKFENSVYDVAARLGTLKDSFPQTLSATLAIISRNENKWLLVLDNMDQLDLSDNMVKLVSGHWQQGASGHLLITTRRKPTAVTHDIRYLNERACLSLKSFEIDEGKKFLFRRVGIVHDKEVDIVAEKLVKELGGLPLALEQAGAYIKSLSCTLSQYLELYGKQRLHLLNRRQKATRVTEYDSPERLAVLTTWHLNFEHIKLTVDDGKAVIRFLYASAFLNPDEIQKDIINVGEPPIEDEEFNECVKTTLGCQQILKILTEFSLFKETLSSNLSVHHLVQEVVQNNLNKEEELQAITDAIRLVHHAFQNCSSPDELLSSERQRRPSTIFSDKSRFYKWHKLCSHSYELVNHVKRVIKQLDVDRGKLFQAETARIVYECAIHLSVTSKHEEAKKVANFANVILNFSHQQVPASSFFPHIIPLPELVRRHIQYSCNMPGTTSSKHERAESSGMPADSVTFEQLDEMRKKGNDLFKKGLYKDALKTYSDAIDMSKENTISFDDRLLSNRASAYLRLGQYKEALQDAEEYILRLPRCWKGYARKALALVELESIKEACVPASIAYYYNRDIFRNYGPFKSRFGSSFEMRLFVCHDISDLSTALLKVKSQLTWDNKPDNSPIILLEPGDYHISIDTVDPSLISDGSMFYIRSCILVGCEGECTVSFDKTLHIAIMNSFVAYNVNFTNNQSEIKISGNCFSNRADGPYTSLTCFGKLKASRCKFHNSIRGGLLVIGCAEVKNSEYFDNPGGLEVRDGGRLLVRGSKVYGNTQGLLIGPKAKECVVEDCEIYDNKLGGVVVTECVSGVEIKSNRIYDNDESGVLVSFSSDISILANEISSNSDWGVHISGKSHAFVKKNKIQKNRFGGIGLTDISSVVKSAVIETNDISFNCGPAIYVDKDSVAERRGNKLEGNKEDRNQSTAQSEVKLCYCCEKPEMNLKKCTKCYTAQYCGKKCQKNDWKNHKENCGRLLSDASVVFEYVRRPVMTGHLFPNKQKWQNRAPGLEPVGPAYCKQPNTTTRFIVKMSAGFQPDLYQDIVNPAYEVNLYDRSLTIDGKLSDALQIYELVQQYGTIGQLNSYWKKLFMWVKGPEDGKLRVFINEFPPYQKW